MSARGRSEKNEERKRGNEVPCILTVSKHTYFFISHNLWYLFICGCTFALVLMTDHQEWNQIQQEQIEALVQYHQEKEAELKSLRRICQSTEAGEPQMPVITLHSLLL